MEKPRVERKHKNFVAALSDEELRTLTQRGRTRRFRRGQTLLGQGETSDRLILIRAGRVKVAVVDEDGREAVLAMRGAGEIVGEQAALDGEPRSATVTAVEEVEALLVEAADFDAAAETHPRLLSLLSATVTHRMRTADRKRVEAAWLDVPARIARTLLELADAIGERTEGGGVILPLSQRELAGCVGASREAVTRALQQLHERNVVATSRRRLAILDLEALRTA
ncbi:MAG: Crp/Fnr family transcriptional regulator [Actinomycetota bacterium]|nr:Crp/Fnr family transcriptional regulator [Actinomycetota bacterium]